MHVLEEEKWPGPQRSNACMCRNILFAKTNPRRTVYLLQLPRKRLKHALCNSKDFTSSFISDTFDTADVNKSAPGSARKFTVLLNPSMALCVLIVAAFEIPYLPVKWRALLWMVIQTSLSFVVITEYTWIECV